MRSVSEVTYRYNDDCSREKSEYMALSFSVVSDDAYERERRESPISKISRNARIDGLEKCVKARLGSDWSKAG